ncbi:MAG: DoxX family protein [Acidobacteriota bacterium]|jgi:putative oxidoreductase
MKIALDKYRDLGLLIVRLGFGFGFIYFHGWGKITGGPEAWANYGAAMENFGIGFGHTFFGFMAALTETVGGLMFAAGLFFRPVCLLLASVMFVAASQHFITGRGTPAHAFKNFFLFVGIALVGPGKYSLDARMGRKS